MNTAGEYPGSLPHRPIGWQTASERDSITARLTVRSKDELSSFTS
jgi:hypothetical protein